MKKILLVTLLFGVIYSYAQDDKVIIPTPESASLIKWSQNDVNLSSGTLNTTIPLYELKDGNLSVPIALHYNGANGIKVEEAATWVGLGWDLVAGGKVVRLVRDKPDEAYTINHIRNEQGGFDGANIGFLAGKAKFKVSYQNETLIYRGGWAIQGNPTQTEDFLDRDPMLFDTQPDLYIVNIGTDIIKFMLDEYRKPHIINNKDYKIEMDWGDYDPSLFYTKQSWSAGVSLDLRSKLYGGLDEKGSANVDAQGQTNATNSGKGMLKNNLPGTLGITVGLNQWFNKDRELPKYIGFKGWKITASDGTIYYFGGDQAYMDFNFDDQAYLNNVDRITIAVNNMHQRLPSAWNLKRIESPFGTVGQHNAIDFTYIRTGHYEPFHSPDDLVDPIGPCDAPESKQDKFAKSIRKNPAIRLDSLLGNINGSLSLSFSAPSAEDLEAYVTLNTRVVYGTILSKISSPNFEVRFNSYNLFEKTLSEASIRKIIPDFDAFDFSYTKRKDLQREYTFSSEEERRKGFGERNADGSITIHRNNWEVSFGSVIATDLSLGKDLDINDLDFGKMSLPEIHYDNGNINFDLNSQGAFFNWQGKVYQTNLAGELEQVLSDPLSLKNIEIYDKASGKSRGFYFDYDYFDTFIPEGYTNSDYDPEHTRVQSGEIDNISLLSDLPRGYYEQLHKKYAFYDNSDRKRLKLSGVYEMQLKETGLTLLPGHTFEYNNTPLPRRLSMAQDHWGFYNGQHINRNKTQFASSITYKMINNETQEVIEPEGEQLCQNGSNRTANLEFTKAGILNAINFPTGGRKTFYYGLNDAGNFSIPIGGLRIDSIQSYEPVTNKIYTTEYDYANEFGKSTGKLAAIPDYYFKHPEVSMQGNSLLSSSYYQRLLNNFVNDSYIAYERVIERQKSGSENIGYTIYEFNNSERSVLGGENVYLHYNLVGEYQRYYTEDEIIQDPDLVNITQPGYRYRNAYYFLDEKPYYDYGKNSLSRVRKYNNHNVLVYDKKYLYSDYFFPSENDYVIPFSDVVSRRQKFKLSVGVSAGIFVNFGDGPLINPELSIAARLNVRSSGEVYDQQFRVKRFDLLKEIETVYDTDGSNPVTSEKEYNYSFTHHNPIVVSTIDSKGDTIKNHIHYSQDSYNLITKTFNSGNLELLNEDPFKWKNKFLDDLNDLYINFPIEEYTTVNGFVTTGKITQLDSNKANFTLAGLPQVEHILELEKPLPVDEFSPLELIRYNIRELDEETGHYLFKDYYYYSRDPHFKPRVDYLSYNSKGMLTKYGKTGDVITSVDYGYNDLIPIRKTVGFGTPLERSTYYEYIPLYGVTKETPPNGLIINYEYDEIGRLMSIKNYKGELIKSYQYNYQGQ